MTKPIGIFSTRDGVPPWASFAVLRGYASEEDFAAAAEISRVRPGFAWVLSLMGETLTTPIAATALAVRDKLARHGLVPTALVYGEEWYHPDQASHFGGLTMAGIAAVHGWVGAQHASIRSVWPGVPIVAIEGWFHDRPDFGPDFWRPVPFGTDIVAIEAYVPHGHTWDGDLMDAKFAYATGGRIGSYRSPRREPVVLIAQCFRAADGWREGPTADTLARSAAWLRHPRVIACWCFDWASLPPHIEGLRDLTARPMVQRALGIPS